MSYNSSVDEITILGISYMTNMTFAPGWTQSIDTSTEGQERADLASYISDTFKAIHGIRPSWWGLSGWSLETLRGEAKSLEGEVVASIQRERAEEARRQAEMAAHHEAVAAAMKPVSLTHHPFANLKEML